MEIAPSENYVTRTLRLKKEPDMIIVNDAKENGVSINCFYNQIIDKYVNAFRLIEKFPCLAIPCEMIKEFLNEISKEKIEHLGKIFGEYIPKQSLFLKEKDLSAENMISLMKSSGQGNNWFQFCDQKKPNDQKIMLKHSYGLNWSIFLKNFYQTIFYEIYKKEIKIDVGGNSLLIFLPKNSKT